MTWLTGFRRIVITGCIVELGHAPRGYPEQSESALHVRLTKLHNDSLICGTDVSASSDMFTMGSHNGTHIDALNPIACCGMVYPERDLDAVATRRDAYTENGIETVEPLFMRGVLLDMLSLLGVESLAPAYGMTAADLAAVASRAGVEIRPGDEVLICSGWERYWGDHRKYVGVFGGARSRLRRGSVAR